MATCEEIKDGGKAEGKGGRVRLLLRARAADESPEDPRGHGNMPGRCGSKISIRETAAGPGYNVF